MRRAAEAAPEGRSWLNQASTALAQRRPSSIAHTISDWPRRASPAANTPRTLVAYVGRLDVAARVACDAERVEQRGSGPTKPIASSTSSAGCDSSVPATGSNGGAPLFRSQWICSTLPLPERCGGRDREAAARRPPSARTTCAASRARAATASARPGGCAGGSPSSSICVTDAAPSRCALATQSAPVSPPPITITCLPAAVMRRARPCRRRRGFGRRGTPSRSARRRARARATGRSRGTREPVQSTIASKPLEHRRACRRRRRSGTRRPRRRAARRAARRRASRS